MDLAALFNNPTFQAARQEFEALGFDISDRQTPGSQPYAVIGGRSNARWWLIPIARRRVSISGMALFQPVIPSAKLLKSAAVTASSLCLYHLWARKILYISGTSRLVDIFGGNDLHYAFFTGTDSPHRKVTVQVMDQDGRIKGFAKTSCNRAVWPVLSHEAETLRHLQMLGLKTAIIPAVLFHGNICGAEVLVTDTHKTDRTKSVSALNGSHVNFLLELAGKTALSETTGTDWFVTELRKRYDAASERLPLEWQRRLARAIDVLDGSGGNWRTSSLSHGDFTPWNTFFVDGMLYVFDWEYADYGRPPGFDLMHFVMSLPKVKRLQVNEKIDHIRSILQEWHLAQNIAAADSLLLSYLCHHSLHYAARELAICDSVSSWDGEQEAAVIVDALNNLM